MKRSTDWIKSFFTAVVIIIALTIMVSSCGTIGYKATQPLWEGSDLKHEIYWDIPLMQPK